jgi:hypothetical protein
MRIGRLFRLHLLACVATAVAAAALAVAGAPRPAGAQGFGQLSCDQLWHERNAIYAQHGHCFKTARGIAAFGRGCFPPYGRLPPHAQATVSDIIQWERRRGCPGAP